MGTKFLLIGMGQITNPLEWDDNPLEWDDNMGMDIDVTRQPWSFSSHLWGLGRYKLVTGLSKHTSFSTPQKVFNSF